jgi:hypothetical protein
MGSCEIPVMERSRNLSSDARESPSVLRRGVCQGFLLFLFRIDVISQQPRPKRDGASGYLV